jgi:pimeloyl-ACP methyl ester carboxylesterase
MDGLRNITLWAPQGETAIAYRVLGSGPPVLLLHGWPLTAWSWRKVAPLLAARFALVIPDLPGLGDSERPARSHAKRQVGAALLALMDHLGHGRFAIVGHDMGVPVGYAMARAAPERVSAFAMLDVPPIVPVNALAGFAPWHFGFHAVPDLPEILTAGRERDYLRFWFTGAYPHAITDADLDEYVRTYAAPGAMSAGFGYYRAFPQDIADFADAAAARLAMPVLALHGEYSPLGALIHAVADEICLAPRQGMIAGAGHYIPEEAPAPLAAALVPFLTGETPS